MFKLRVCGLSKGEEKKISKQNLTPMQIEVEMKPTVIFFSFNSLIFEL